MENGKPTRVTRCPGTSSRSTKKKVRWNVEGEAAPEGTSGPVKTSMYQHEVKALGGEKTYRTIHPPPLTLCGLLQAKSINYGSFLGKEGGKTKGLLVQNCTEERCREPASFRP